MKKKQRKTRTAKPVIVKASSAHDGSYRGTFELRRTKLFEVMCAAEVADHKETHSDSWGNTPLRRHMAGVREEFNTENYWAYRKEIAERLKRRSSNQFRGYCGESYSHFFAFSNQHNWLRLGCCVFTGKDAQAIKKWARELPKEKRLR